MSKKIMKAYRFRPEVINVINRGLDIQNKSLIEQGLDKITETEFIEKAIINYYNQTFNLDEIARIKDNEHKYIYDIINRLINEHTATLSKNQEVINDTLLELKKTVKAANAASDVFGKFSNDRMNRADIRFALENYNNDDSIIDRIEYGASSIKNNNED